MDVQYGVVWSKVYMGINNKILKNIIRKKNRTMVNHIDMQAFLGSENSSMFKSWPTGVKQHFYFTKGCVGNILKKMLWRVTGSQPII